MPILEISDLVVRHDAATGEALPVRRDEVLAELRAAGDRRGARIAAGLPHHTLRPAPHLEALAAAGKGLAAAGPGGRPAQARPDW